MSESKLVSLRTELLVTFVFLAALATSIALTLLLLFGMNAERSNGTLLTALLLVDLAVVFMIASYQVRRSVILPLRAVMSSAERVSAGDLASRAPEGANREFAALAQSLNRMTDTLVAQQWQLLRAEKLASIGRLAAGVAHEIGNPLGAIAGYVHLAKRQATDAERVTETLEGVEREVGRIDRIVRGLLDYSRPRADAAHPVSPDESISSAVELVRDQGALRDIVVEMQLQCGNARILGSSHDLIQLFVNLLLNSIDAVAEKPAGDRLITIHTERLDVATLGGLRPRRENVVPETGLSRGPLAAPSQRVTYWLSRNAALDEAVSIVVADSGSGVAPDDAERIFDPFFTTKDPGKGTGLGLAIVLGIVERLHGTIWVAPAREGGAAFHILFPAVRAAAVNHAAPDTAAPGVAK